MTLADQDVKIKWEINFLTFLNTDQKSRIRETDADSSTDAIGGLTKNTPKPVFFEKLKKSSETRKLKTSRNMPKLAMRPSTRGL